MADIRDINEKLLPEWLQKGKRVLDRLPDADREAVTAFIFNVVLADVKRGLEGEDAEVFFQAINQEYEKAHGHCYFNEQYDGNAVPFSDDTPLCLVCAVKVRNVLRWYVDHPKPRYLI